MKKINIRRIWYKLRHDYLNSDNIVILIALVIASGFVWGSLNVMQRNYKLQKELDDKSRQLLVAKLDNQNAKLSQRYYNTTEYKELAVREKLGLAEPGESVLILPKNSQEVINSDKELQKSNVVLEVKKSNFQQWIGFLTGSNVKTK